MQTVAINDPRVDHLLNVLVTDDFITVRTFGLRATDQDLNKGSRIGGDLLWDYLGGLGKDRKPFHPWKVSMGFIRWGAWFTAKDAGMSLQDIGGEHYRHNLDCVVLERDASTIERRREVLGSGNDSDATMYVWSTDNRGILHFENRTLATLAGRSSLEMEEIRTRRYPLVSLFQPYADTPWSQCKVKIHKCAYGLKVWHNLAKSEEKGEEWDRELSLEEYQVNPFFDHRPISFGIEGPDTVRRGERTLFEVHALGPDGLPDTACNSTLYLEPIAGVVPFTRVQFQRGTAVVPVIPAYLDPGEQLRVKFGWRNYPGLGEITAVVE